MKKKKTTLNEYVAISKCDIYVYGIISVILFFFLLYISYKEKVYYILLLDIVVVARTFEKIQTYFTLKKIRNYLIEHELINQLGDIDFWNERNYFLTDNYFVILQNKMVSAIKYSDIQRIFKEKDLQLTRPGGVEEYLHILTDNNEYTVLINTTFLVGEEYRDISDYLLGKNPSIIVDTNIKNKKFK